MAISISSFLNKSSTSIHFLMLDTDLRGGFRVVADEAARLAIPLGARVNGMLVFQTDTSQMYQFQGGTADVNCVPYDTTSQITVGDGLSNDGSTISVDNTYLATLYAAVSHAHTIADVTNLQTTLDGLASSAHTHAIGDIDDIAVVTPADTDLLQYNTATSKWENKSLANAGVAASVHTHAISDTTGLQTALDGKADTSHAHAIADVTNLQTTLDGKAPVSHNHAISDVTNLQTTLDGLADAAHTHAVADISDIVLTSTADKDMLQYDTASGNWVNKSLADAGVAASVHTHAISDVTDLQTTLDGLADAAHTHAFSELTAVPQVSAMPGVTISGAEPTSGDGVDGDIWFVIP